MDNLIEVEGPPDQNDPGSNKPVYFFGSGSRKKDSKVSFVLLKVGEKKSMEHICSIHINRVFKKVTKIERHQENIFVAAAFNSVFILEVSPSNRSIEIVAHADLNIRPTPGISYNQEKVGFLTDFVVAQNCLFYFADDNNIFIKEFKESSQNCNRKEEKEDEI